MRHRPKACSRTYVTAEHPLSALYRTALPHRASSRTGLTGRAAYLGRSSRAPPRDSTGCRSPYGHAIWADACDRVFSARCIVQSMLTIASRLDVMNRLGRALADPTRSRIILTLLDHPAYPAELARDLDLTRPNVSNHLACLRDCGIVVSEPEGRRTRYEIADSHLAQALTALVDATLAVDEDAPCIDPACSLPGCDAAGEGA